MSQTENDRLQADEDEISLIDLAAVIWKHKWLILGIPFLVGLGTVIYAVISIVLPPELSPMPNVYRAQAVVLLSDDVGSGGALQAALASSGLAGMAGFPGVQTSSSGDLAVMLLGSNTIVDRVVEDFDIIQRHNIEEAPRTRARELIRDKSSFTFRPETNTVVIAYEDIDPEFSARVARRFVELLVARFDTIGSTQNQRQVRLLELKIAEVETEIFRLEEEIQDFQREYGTISPQVFAQEQIRILAEMRARLINKEMELSAFGEFTRADHPVTQQLTAERDQLRLTITELEQRYFGARSNGNSAAQRPAFGSQDIPELSVRFGRLERELRVQAGIYEVLTRQYEVTRLSLDGDEAQLQVLEPADVPELKSGPSRAIMVIVATFASGFLAVFLAFFLEFLHGLRADPEVRAKFAKPPSNKKAW